MNNKLVMYKLPNKSIDFKKSKTIDIIKDFLYLCSKEVDQEMKNDTAFSESEKMTKTLLNDLN